MARFLILSACVAVFLACTSGARADDSDEVKYFGSGWPINLVDAACSDDEGCQTELANCPPRTDGACSAQVALCTIKDDAVVKYEGLCTVRLSVDGKTIFARLPDGDLHEVDFVDPSVVEAIRGQRSGSICADGKAKAVCFRTIVSKRELTDWAEGRAQN